MKNRIKKSCLIILILVTLIITVACNNNEEKKKTAQNLPQNPAVATNQVQPATPATNIPAAPAVNIPKSKDLAVSVNSNNLKKSELEKDFKERFKPIKDKIPADKLKEVRAGIKKQIIDEYIMRTLLAGEVERRKIEASSNEINEAMNQIKSSLPPGKKMEEFLKENKISKYDIALGIKVRKIVDSELGNKAKPSEAEITKFYNENKDKFLVPENVHVRHILITFAEGDTDKIKAEKKVKIEGLRKQLVDGADFAEVARKNSDCPSKENGGDLGLIRKEQTVKPFEDAAFSQAVKAIGTVVTTEYGYHIIQVLEHNQQKTVALAEAKSKIAPYLEQQKQSEAFGALLKKLRENAKITVYEN